VPRCGLVVRELAVCAGVCGGWGAGVVWRMGGWRGEKGNERRRGECELGGAREREREAADDARVLYMGAGARGAAPSCGAGRVARWVGLTYATTTARWTMLTLCRAV
jgi:hypothetical protein